jgi:trimethylamine--corrinoid protein Co-methyltransferase
MCYEQFVIDLELAAMLRHFLQPLDVSDEALALETVAEAGPGGFFLDAAHTLKHHRGAHFLPSLSVRQLHEQWLAEGGLDAARRANRRCRALLESYVQPPIESAVVGRLHDFIERRKAALLR